MTTEQTQEITRLKALVRELLAALQVWADSKDDLALDELCERAKKEGTP